MMASRFSALSPSFVLLLFILFSPHLLSQHADPLRICGLSPRRVDRIAKESIERLRLRAVHRAFHRMADQPLDIFRRGAVFFGDRQIYLFSEAIKPGL